MYEEEPNSLGLVYDDITCLLDKGGDSLKWGEPFHMFKRHTFLVEDDDQDELDNFKKNQRSRIHRVEADVGVFPCVYAISWILKDVELEKKYILHSRGEAIASFQLGNLEKYYHLEKGT